VCGASHPGFDSRSPWSLNSSPYAMSLYHVTWGGGRVISSIICINHVVEHNLTRFFYNAADLYYNILDGAGHGMDSAGCAPPLYGAANASSQTVSTTSPASSMVHNPAAAWADFGSQPFLLPGHGIQGGGDLQYAIDGEFIKLCRAADAYPPENGVGIQYKISADPVGQEGAAGRSLQVFLETKGASAFAAEPAMGPVVDFMEAILGSSSMSAASASSVGSFSANTGMQPHTWIP
jgi:transcription factor MYB, plant